MHSQNSFCSLLKKCGKHLYQFNVVWTLFSRDVLATTDADRDDEQFSKAIDHVLHAMTRLLKEEGGDPSGQGGCLKFLPSIIDLLMPVFPARKLAERLVELASSVPTGHLQPIKLSFIGKVMHSQLFLDPDCRFSMLPTVTSAIQHHIPGTAEVISRITIA